MQISRIHIFLIHVSFMIASCSLDTGNGNPTNGGTRTGQTADLGSIERAGKFEDHAYTNAELGISFKLPDCFSPLSDAETSQTMNEGMANVGKGRSDKEANELREGIKRSVFLLNVRCSSFGGKTVGAHILIIAEAIPSGIGSKRFAEVSRSNSLPRPGVTMLRDIHLEKIGADEFETMDLAMSHDGIPIKQKHIFKTLQNVGVTMVITDSYDLMMPVILESMQTLSWTK